MSPPDNPTLAAALYVTHALKRRSRRAARPGVTEAGFRRVWMHHSIGKGSSVSPEAVTYCRQHDIRVIAGACPMMYGGYADFGHTCMRWILKLTGGLPV